MLSVSHLSCVRGERPLFAGVDFTVEPGGWLHVRGANGSGKTSLLRILAGLSQPAAGQIRWNGHPVSEDPQEFRRNLMYLGHHAGVKDELTARENIELAGSLDGGHAPVAQSLESLRQFGLKGRENLPVRFLSAGQKRRVLLARLVSRKARLWILDEPFTALDVRAVDMLGNLVGDHVSNGGMAVITSHQAVPVPGGKTLDL